MQQIQLVRKENTCKRVQVPLYPTTWIRFVPVAVGSWLKKEERKEKKKKNDAFKKDKVKRRALFFSLLLSFLPRLPSALPLPICC